MLSGPEERCSGSTKPPGSFALASGRLREGKAECLLHEGEEGAGGFGVLGEDSASAPTTCHPCLPRSLGCSTGSVSGHLPRDWRIKLVSFVKRPELKIKNNKARETENANLTAASEEGCSTEPEARNSPSFLLCRVGVFFSVN